ncbi:MAG: hypothetical protein LBJ00_17735 [Planctomycetaceae bacterium]|nr:hypothetical protein [Planctomycetaceae bacterium]
MLSNCPNLNSVNISTHGVYTNAKLSDHTAFGIIRSPTNIMLGLSEQV